MNLGEFANPPKFFFVTIQTQFFYEKRIKKND